MKKPDEEIVEVNLLGLKSGSNGKVKVAYTNAIDKGFANHGNFTFPGQYFEEDHAPERIVSVWAGLCSMTVSVWERSKDGVYRSKIDIDINSKEHPGEGEFSITKMMPGGSERRVDLSILSTDQKRITKNPRTQI